MVRRDLPMPSNLNAPNLEKSEFHRISVAFGLSCDWHGKFIPPENIEKFHYNLAAAHEIQYIGSEQM